MRLNGHLVSPVRVASGTLNFFGDGYPFHKPLKKILPKKFGFKGAAFTAKTTTLEKKAGNMPLCSDGTTPTELKPKCIYIDPFFRFALNAVGLSGPGAEFLFKTRRWQTRNDKGLFFISFMAVDQARQDRIVKFKEFLKMFRRFTREFQGVPALQINISCPNVGRRADTQEAVDEVWEMLSLVWYGLVIEVKADPLFEAWGASKISKHVNCSSITLSNAIKFSAMPREIRRKYFPNDRSPLHMFGGGGFSGNIIRPFALEAVRRAVREGVNCPIIGGGGITHPRHVDEFKDAGAHGVQVGSASFLRPHQTQAIVNRGLEVFN